MARKKGNGVKRFLITVTVVFAAIVLLAFALAFNAFGEIQEKTVTQEDVTTYLSQDQIISDAMSGFSHLTEDEQKAYLRLVNEIETMPETLDESDNTLTVSMEGNQVTTDELAEIYYAIQQDHPEFFWISKYNYTYLPEDNQVQQIILTSTMTKDEIAQNQQKLDTWTEQVLANLPGGDYSNAIYLHDYIIENTTYNLNAPNNQNLISVIDGESVCAGYAKAYQYLLNQAGLFATTVIGTVENGQAHAWNLVKLDGEYGWVDVTWDDPNYDNESFAYTSYLYFGQSTDEINKTHTLDAAYDYYQSFDEPSWNYFVRTGHDYDLSENGAVSSIVQTIRAAIQNGDENVYVRVADMDQVDQLLTELSNNSISSDYTLTYVKDVHYPVLMFAYK